MDKAELSEKLHNEFEEVSRHAEEVDEYREQIRQHSLTICAMEDHLNQAATKAKEYQLDMTLLKSKLNGAFQIASKQVTNFISKSIERKRYYLWNSKEACFSAWSS